MDNFQFAYKPFSSTTCATTVLHHNIVNFLDKSSYMSVIVLSFDFSKEFDTIPHNLLLTKLYSKSNVPRNFVSWIQSYLSSDRSQCVKVIDIFSDYLDVSSGVPQGSLLGPLLFSIFTSDLCFTNNNCVTIKYADDTVILCPVLCSSDCNLLISDIVNYASSYDIVPFVKQRLHELRHDVGAQRMFNS